MFIVLNCFGEAKKLDAEFYNIIHSHKKQNQPGRTTERPPSFPADKLTMKLSTALPFLLSVAASPAFVSSSKSSKSNTDDCPPPTQEVSCNSTFDSGEVITLAGDVVCEGNITQAVGVRDAAITVSGVGTVVDCNGFSVRQKTDSSAAAVDCRVFPTADNSTQIRLMKETCDLYYVWGIKVENGATVKNCNVQQFWGGVEILNGGSVENSQASLNFRGLEVLNFEDNTQSNVKGRYVKSCVLFLCAVLFANADIDFWIGCVRLLFIQFVLQQWTIWT